MKVTTPVIESFDDISHIHQEIPGYEYCVRVDFETPLEDQSDNEELQAYWEQKALIEVFGDSYPKDILFDWRDDQELWLRYNIGASNSTLSPSLLWPLETRRRLLAVIDAKQLEESATKDIAEWLEHFYGYPQDDLELSSCEREVLISNEGDPDKSINFVVYLPGKTYEFETEDEAYIFVIANYGSFLFMYDVENQS